MNPCDVCKYGLRIPDQYGGYVTICRCPDNKNCKSCNRDDVPKILKVEQ